MADAFRRLLPRSAITRLLLLLFALQLAVSALVLGYAYLASARAVEREERAAVAGLRDDLLAEWRGGGEPALARLIATRLATPGADLVALLVGRDGRPLAGNLDAWPATVVADTDWRVITLYRRNGLTPEAMGVAARLLPGGARLLAGRAIDGNFRLAAINARALTAALLIAAPLAWLMSALLGRVINRRLDAIATTAVAVADGDLARRVPRDRSGDAFDALGAGINAMLARIETLVAELRIVTDGLAHDLRSPLTRLTSMLERARADTRDPAALAALDGVAAEAEQLLTMLATALQISRAEAGIGRDRFADTDIDALVADLAELFEPVAEDAGIALTAEATAGHVRVHRTLTQQALTNLVENALKYADGATTIRLSARRDGDSLVLSVADNGPGIPADRRDEARRRFVRLDPARHVAGSGLGLALVDAVARLHGGALTLADDGPGLRAELTLPA